VSRFIQEVKRLKNLESRFEDVIQGKMVPRRLRDIKLFAEICFAKKYYAAAARFWRLPDETGQDAIVKYKDDTLRTFALAAARRGKDGQSVGETELPLFRSEAFCILHFEIKSTQESLPNRRMFLSILRRWRQDPALETVRHPEALAKLPPKEREDWEELWKAIDEKLSASE